MKRAVIVSSVRTAVGAYGGQWADYAPDKMMGKVISEAMKRVDLDPALVEDVVMGNIYGVHGNIARVAALYAGIPVEASAVTVDRQCGSGTQAIAYAALNIMAGVGDVYIACGMESMTQTPYQMHRSPRAFSPTPPTFAKNTFAPAEMFDDLVMPQTADKLAKLKGISREACDEFALLSQQRAAKAIQSKLFQEEILAFEVKTRKGISVIDTDECVRYDTDMEKLGKLKPLYEGGVTTVANSCPRSDGAAAVVIMSEERARELSLEPMAYVHSFATAGVDPTIMGYGPVPAVEKVLKRSGLKLSDIDCIELNEAFAGQVLACLKDMKLEPEQINPNGGAIALGHPLGGTGVILTTKLLYEMKRKNYSKGMVTMCIGGGQGMAMILERC